MIPTHRLIPAFAALILSAPLLQAQTFQGLGFLFEPHSIATDVSADGSVVVGHSTVLLPPTGGPLPQGGAFRWSDGQMTPLPHAYSQYRYGNYARGVSGDGTVIVGFSAGHLVGQARAATRWVGLSASDVGPNVYAEAYATSDDGSVVVGQYSRHTLRVSDGTPHYIEIGQQSLARDVSADGNVMVGYTFSPSTRAYRWENSTVELLPGFPEQGENPYTDAHGISADGTIIVGTAENADGKRMVRWVNSVIEDLGGFGVAYSTSGNGQVIVGDDDGIGSAKRPLIWTPSRGVEDLRTYLVDQIGLDLTGWTLISATSVSRDGGTVVGFGLNPSGKQEAWRATFRASNDLIVNVDGDAADAKTDDSSCDTDLDAPGPQCTLRAAIQAVLAGHGARITFAITNASVPRIVLQSALPAVTVPIEIDGTTQSGGRVEVRGLPDLDGLHLSGGKSVVKGLILNGFTRVGETGGTAIRISGAGNNTITANYIGTDATGNAAFGNRLGIGIDGSPGNVIGGAGADANIISGNEFGILIRNLGANGNRIAGNRIGLAANGGFRRNLTGVFVGGGSGNLVGGAGPNLMASSEYDVIVAADAGAVTGTEISGNLIGLNGAGTDAGDPTKNVGVLVAAFDNNTVGGTRVVGNRIAGHSIGIWVLGPGVTGTEVVSNRVGLAFNETGSLPTGLTASDGTTGIRTEDAPGVIVEGNIIAGQRLGILAAGSSQATGVGSISGEEIKLYGPNAPLSNDPGAGNDVNIVGNTVGLNMQNAVPLGAVQDYGIVVFGGARTARIANNTVAAYAKADIWLSESSSLTVVGNRIGTADGRNHASVMGVYVENVDTATVGGADLAARNIISRHSEAGVFVEGESRNITIRNNTIGTDIAGTAAWPNGVGIIVNSDDAGIPNLLIEDNLVSGNVGMGVGVEVANTGNTQIIGNRIGVSPNGVPVGNGGGGLYLANTPATVSDNYLAHNDGAAIKIIGEAAVKISENFIYENDAGIDYSTAPFAPPSDVLVMRTNPLDQDRVGVFVAVPAIGAPGEVTIEVFGNRNCNDPEGRVLLLSSVVPGNRPMVRFFSTESLSSFGTMNGFTATATRGASTSAFSVCGEVLPFADSDDDGATDLFEVLGGDRNGDGVSDISQRNVATHLSIPLTGSPQFVTLVSAPGTTVQQSIVFTADLPPLEGVIYKIGLIAFDIQGVPIGTQTTMDILLDSGRPADAEQYVKLPRIESMDFRFMPETGTADRAERTATGWRLYLTDGGEWDVDGTANGRIRDPGGPVIRAALRPTLFIRRSSNAVVMSWPLGMDFKLETTLTLTNRFWEPVTAPVTTVGGLNTVTFEATGESRFFRLSH